MHIYLIGHVTANPKSTATSRTDHVAPGARVTRNASVEAER